MSSTPGETEPAILHDASSRSEESNPPALAHVPYRSNAPMIHPRLPRTDAPAAAGMNDHVSTTWSQDDQGRPVSLHHSWHPNHPAPREPQPHASTANYGYMRDSRPLRSSPDYFQYRRPPSRQQIGYRHYDDQNRVMISQYNQRVEPSNAYYEAKRLEQEALRKDFESKTGLLLPPHNTEPAPIAYHQPAPVRPMAPSNNGNGCSCKKSKCLKLYCACFSNSILCRADCKCDGCLNSSEESQKKENAIQAARKSVLDRNPKAFDDKVGQGDLGVVRPVFSRVMPMRRMPEYDFRSLERVRADSISPREGVMRALPPVLATPAVVAAPLEEPKKPASEEGGVKESTDNVETKNEESAAPEEAKVDDNATEKSEGASKSPETHAELASISTMGSLSRPVVFNRNPSPRDGYYRPSPTYRQSFAWDARQYPREIEQRRNSFTYYDQGLPSHVPHHIADGRISREMHPYQYRTFEPHTVLPLTDAHLPKQHRVGCKCKKSMCLKKYCECFQNSIKCGMSCKCVNCGNKPGAVKNASRAEQMQDKATEEAVNTMVSLGQTVSLESEDAQNVHTASEDNAPSFNGRPPSLPSSIASTLNHTDGEESLKENPKPSEQNLDFLATLATSALDDLKRDKRKAEEMELAKTVSNDAENKRSRIGVPYDYYDNSYNQSYRWINSTEQTLKAITTQVQNQTASAPKPVRPAPVSAKSSKLPKGLTFRKVCSNCGRQRAEHGEFGFGNKCPLATCGKCGADAHCHQINKVPMGVMCTLTESDGAIAGCSAKYEAVLADLAARAEIRAEIGRAE